MLEERIFSTHNVNEGLRSYMLRVYNYMAGGLLVSALFARVGTSPSILRLMYNVGEQGASLSLFGILLLIAPFVLVFMISSAVASFNAAKAQLLFWIFSGLMGLSFSPILLAYSNASLATTFLVTAGAFAGLSLYGYTTSKDLTGMGQFAFMGLWGIILAIIINWFVKSPSLDYAVSIIGVVIFTIFTAYDTQRIRRIYQLSPSTDTTKALSISGALTLYLDFINLFLFLLRFLGNRQR